MGLPEKLVQVAYGLTGAEFMLKKFLSVISLVLFSSLILWLTSSLFSDRLSFGGSSTPIAVITPSATLLPISVTSAPTGISTPTKINKPSPTNTISVTVLVTLTLTLIATPSPETDTPLPDQTSESTTTPTLSPIVTPTSILSVSTPTNTPSIKLTPTPPHATKIIYVQSNLQAHYLGIVKPDGSSIQEELHHYAAAPAWSPDGTKIAFFGEQGISQLGGIYQQGNGIWLIDAQGQNPYRSVDVDHVKNLAWSPDGTKLAFEIDSPSGDPEVEIVDANNGSEISRFAGKQPAWSPDSQKLVINTCNNSACGLWRVDFLGGNEEQLTIDSNDSFPAWSKTNYLAFSRKLDDNWEIYLLQLSNPQLQQQITNRPNTDTTPVFSPDGQEIYIYTDFPGGSNHWRIMAIPLDSRKERTVKEGVGQSDEWGLARPAVR